MTIDSSWITDTAFTKLEDEDLKSSYIANAQLSLTRLCVKNGVVESSLPSTPTSLVKEICIVLVLLPLFRDLAGSDFRETQSGGSIDVYSKKRDYYEERLDVLLSDFYAGSGLLGYDDSESEGSNNESSFSFERG